MVNVSADFLPQKQNKNYTLVVTSNNATACNLSYISYPDKSFKIFNLPMTQNANSFFITISAPNYSQLGVICHGIACTDSSSTLTGSDCKEITPSGSIVTPVQIPIYLFFMLLCLVLFYFSVRVLRNNPFSKDKMRSSDEYQMSKENKFMFYIHMLKKKFWIVGVFGIYLSFFLFVAILDLLVYNLGLSEIDRILLYVNNILAWGAIPFVLFWFIYLLIFFYKSFEDMMRHQFGVGRRE